jgi:hypothetical protein
VLIFLDENLNPVDLTVDGGDLRRITLGANLSTWGSAHPSDSTPASSSTTGTTSTRPTPISTTGRYGGNGALRFDLTDVMTGRLTASYSRATTTTSAIL